MDTKRNNDWEFRLSQSMDGQLSPAQAEELRARIDTDADLTEASRKYQALETTLQQIGDETPDIDYSRQRQSIVSRLSRREVIRSGWRFRMVSTRVAAVAAGVLLAVGLSFLVFQNGAQNSGPSQQISFSRPVASMTLVPPSASSGGEVRSDLPPLDFYARLDRQVRRPSSGGVIISIGSDASKNGEGALEYSWIH